MSLRLLLSAFFVLKSAPASIISCMNFFIFSLVLSFEAGYA
jgi:hypothetical protein